MEWLKDFLQLYAKELFVSITVTALTGVMYSLWSFHRWLGRSFFDRLSVTINFCSSEGNFEIRTLQEDSCSNVFRNKTMLRRIIRAARRTQNEQMLKLPDNEYFYYLNPVLNTISEQFAPGFVAEELGESVVKKKLYIVSG